MSSTPPEGRPRNVRRIVLILGLVVVLALVGTAAAAETYFRRQSSNCISAQVEKELGSKVDIHFGPKPLLLTAVDHQVQYVELTSDDASFGPAQDMRVRARLNDINLIDNGRGGATVDNSSADATWSNEGMAKTLSGLVSGVQSDPSTGTLDVKVLGGLADLRLLPRVVGDQIQVTTQSAQLLGLGLPTDLVDGIVQTMTESLQSYPLDLKPTDVKVTDTGIEVKLTGGATKLEGGDGRC
ncbi:LmeA family phospholipid-binding protein [Nocardia sp. NPDC003482]